MFLLEIIKTLLFGIVEGITEWLPVSSTGHLILLNEFIPLSMSADFYEFFEVAIQLGAILAVLFCFSSRLNAFSGDEKKRTRAKRLWKMSFVAALPSAVVGLFLDDILDSYLYNPLTVTVTLIFYGVAFIAVEAWRRGRVERVLEPEDISFRDALGVGCFQLLALIPGTSRSGATILGGMFLGFSRSAAAEFSFFLAIPTMVGASVLKAVKLFASGVAVRPAELILLAVGGAAAFVTSFIVIRFLTDLVKRQGFAAFGVYRIILGTALLLYFAII